MVLASLWLTQHPHTPCGMSGSTLCASSPVVSQTHCDKRKALRKFAVFGSASSSRASRQRRPSTCAQAASTEHATSDQQQAFQAWWRQAQVEADALLPAKFEGIRGMAAAKAIKNGDSVVILPRLAALLVTPKMKCPIPDTIPEAFWSKSQWFVKMALLLLHEKQKGQASAVSGYIQQLPTEFSTLLHWSEQDMQLLMYPHLLKQVQQQRQSWHDYFVDLQAACPNCSICEDDMVWALECVRSRAFSGPYSGPPIKQRAKLVAPFALFGLAYTQIAQLPLEQVLNGAIAAVLFNIIYDTLLSQRLRWYAMCPVIDSMNHQSTSQNEVAYEYFTDRFSVTAQRPYNKGQQVYITYGLQSNDKLLQYYGFVEAKNPTDVYVLPDLLEAVNQMPHLGISKERIAAVQKACSKNALEQVNFSKTGMPKAAMQAMRMLTASEALFSKHSVADFAKQVDPLNEETALQALRDICLRLADAMSRLPAKMSDTKVPHEKQELARMFRQEKARTLQACCRYIDAQLRQLRK